MSAAERYDALTPRDLADLKRAVALLNGRSFAVRLSQAVGQGAAGLTMLIPAPVRSAALRAGEIALDAAMRSAVRHVGRAAAGPRRAGRYWLASGVSGAIGGGFGLIGSCVELPVSTVILMRAIAAIAQDEGEDMTRPDVAAACLEVFALDGGMADASIDSSYFAIRAALARSVREASLYLARKGTADAGAPALVRLISSVASRFGVVVSEKFVAQAIPVIGAGFGAGINMAFSAHFQNLARGHFIMRRLERAYGEALIRRTAESLR